MSVGGGGGGGGVRFQQLVRPLETGRGGSGGGKCGNTPKVHDCNDDGHDTLGHCGKVGGGTEGQELGGNVGGGTVGQGLAGKVCGGTAGQGLVG